MVHAMWTHVIFVLVILRTVRHVDVVLVKLRSVRAVALVLVVGSKSLFTVLSTVTTAYLTRQARDTMPNPCSNKQAIARNAMLAALS